MTLSELLSIDKLKSIEAVAGFEGVNREVTGAVMLDNPEMVNWMREGEILLTTGYVLKDNPHKQIEILDELIKNKAGGLAIKVRRYFDEIPAEMIEKANSSGFPILQLPYYMSLSEISEIINKHIYLAQQGITFQNTISQSLFDLIQRNGSIKSILDQSEQFIKCGLAFLDLRMKIKYKSISFDQYTSDRFSDGDALLPDEKTQNYIKLINSQGTITVDDTTLLGTEGSALIYPIKSAGELLGYLLCVLPQDSSGLGESEPVCQKTALAISLTILREKTFISFKNRETEKFLDSLITEGELSYSEIVKSANYCNMALDAPYICCVISFFNRHDLNETSDWVGIKSLSRRKLSSSWENLSENPCKILVKHNNIVLILSQDRHLSPHEQVAMVTEYCTEIKSTLIDPVYQDPVFFGIGEPVESLAQFYRSYSQALRSVDLMSKKKEEFIGCYRRYILYELIYDSPTAKLALVERLKPLIDYDTAHNTNLIETLDVYFKNCQNSVNASKDLFIHRNTLLYRLERISEVLALDFDDSEQILIMQLALKALIM